MTMDRWLYSCFVCPVSFALIESGLCDSSCGLDSYYYGRSVATMQQWLQTSQCTTFSTTADERF